MGNIVGNRGESPPRSVAPIRGYVVIQTLLQCRKGAHSRSAQDSCAVGESTQRTEKFAIYQPGYGWALAGIGSSPRHDPIVYGRWRRYQLTNGEPGTSHLAFMRSGDCAASSTSSLSTDSATS